MQEILLLFVRGDQMLQIIRELSQINIAQLKEVYLQSNTENGARDYPELDANIQLVYAEQDFYAYLKLFLEDKRSLCAVWAVEGVYKAALRLEPYQDGLLLAGLETAPDARRKGYAKMLVDAVLGYLSEQGSVRVYSHVDKRNTASLAVHRACGFTRILEHAVYADSSVSHSACTLNYIM